MNQTPVVHGWLTRQPVWPGEKADMQRLSSLSLWDVIFYLFLLFYFFVIYNQGKGKFFEPITIQIDFSKSPN